MMDNAVLEKMIKEVMVAMNKEDSYTTKTEVASGARMTEANYPLSEKMGKIIKAPTGKTLDEITIEGVMNGKITAEDVKIAPETLEMQAQVAESVGRDAFARNLRRAAELIAVPDARVLEIYNALRPYRSTKAELLAIADELETKYCCKINSAFVREAAQLYDNRGRLKK
jgi:propanediol dehydratase small subunit